MTYRCFENSSDVFIKLLQTACLTTHLNNRKLYKHWLKNWADIFYCIKAVYIK